MALKDFNSRFSVLRLPLPATPRPSLQPDKGAAVTTSNTTRIVCFMRTSWIVGQAEIRRAYYSRIEKSSRGAFTRSDLWSAAFADAISLNHEKRPAQDWPHDLAIPQTAMSRL